MRICVFCASAQGLAESLLGSARVVGEAIGARGDTLVWGGGRTGLMGEVARAARAAGARTYGVIPEALTTTELADHDSDELHIVGTMRLRKDRMDQQADAFIVLPGGLGTLEELFEIWVLALLKYHHRPIVLVNVDGFYDPLLAWLDTMVQQGVARKHSLDHLIVVDDAADACPQIDAALAARDDA